ncbi:MAG TPA: SGNH/GDSL hydrolase family protein [Myxococcaceae bacterium]|nr:SGNH/GDSL hydrolase family protein [Myxococcaceae bacterium]
MRPPRFPWLLPALALTAGCGPFQPWFDFPAHDNRFQYTGRVELSDGPPTFSYPGTSIRFRFEGEALELRFEDRGAGGIQNTNYVNLFLDDRPPVKLELRHTVERYLVFRELEPGEHTLEIVKRTESFTGATRFLGVSLPGQLLEPPPRPSRRMEFIGDSITCGYGNEARIFVEEGTEPDTGYTSLNQDISHAYGSLTARALGAEVVHVCVSGSGISRDFTGNPGKTMPVFYERTFPYEEGSRWDFQRYVPDAIIINLGTNDFSVKDPDTGLSTAPDREAFKSAYADFVRRLLSRYPEALVVCAIGPLMSDGYPPGTQHWTLIRTWLAELVEELRAEGHGRVHHFAFTPISEPYGEDWHPTAEAHARMAEELTAFLRTLGW